MNSPQTSVTFSARLRRAAPLLFALCLCLSLAATAAAQRVVLDLSEVTWMDSTGLRMLDDLTRAYEGRGAEVRIVAPPDVPARFTLDISAWRPELIVGRMTDALGG